MLVVYLPTCKIKTGEDEKLPRIDNYRAVTNIIAQERIKNAVRDIIRYSELKSTLEDRILAFFMPKADPTPARRKKEGSKS
jgi:hypothetical protein